jgi:hypothetical protein
VSHSRYHGKYLMCRFRKEYDHSNHYKAYMLSPSSTFQKSLARLSYYYFVSLWCLDIIELVLVLNVWNTLQACYPWSEFSYQNLTLPCTCVCVNHWLQWSKYPVSLNRFHILIIIPVFIIFQYSFGSIFCFVLSLCFLILVFITFLYSFSKCYVSLINNNFIVKLIKPWFDGECKNASKK